MRYDRCSVCHISIHRWRCCHNNIRKSGTGCHKFDRIIDNTGSYCDHQLCIQILLLQNTSKRLLIRDQNIVSGIKHQLFDVETIVFQKLYCLSSCHFICMIVIHYQNLAILKWFRHLWKILDCSLADRHIVDTEIMMASTGTVKLCLRHLIDRHVQNLIHLILPPHQITVLWRTPYLLLTH